ncbi:MAG: hypothetical protein ACOC3D_00765 [Pseudomonadota bacterium]
MVRDKLEAPLGDGAEEPRPRLAELPAADLALPSIGANLDTIRAMLAMPGGFGDAMAEAGSGALGAGLVELASEAVLALLDSIRRVRLLVGGFVARDLGLVTGFNAADGD